MQPIIPLCTLYTYTTKKYFNMLVVNKVNEMETVLVESTTEIEMLKMDYHNLKKAALVLRALNHKLRQQMIALIEESGKLTVTEIYVKMRLEQSVASQHLAILRKAGIVETDRDGKFIYYTVSKKRMDEINRFVEDLVG
jgi:ArsR family transcriptional regulator, virulence genes transcriptional regulator